MSLPEKSNDIRLQVFLSHAGVASRRAAEKLITDGRVSVNGTIITEMGTRVALADMVFLDGKPVNTEKRFHYIALNKPPQYICASKDPENRPLALDLLPKDINERLYNVGRLDYLSCGLIFFTNNGGFAAKLTHPSSQIEKEYLIEATGIIDSMVMENFLNGITIGNVLYRAEEAELIGKKTLRVVLVEGKNREIRRVFSHFHLHPKILKRIRIGNIGLGDLAEGKTRNLSEKEVQNLLKIAGCS